MALASGASFAGYTIVRMLSSSATGERYLVQRPDLPGWQTLKILPSALWADGEFRQRFLQETEAAVTLFHLNVVEVYGRGEFDGQLWVATDYLDGSDAAELMANRFPTVLPTEEVLALLGAAAAGLDFAHHRGLLHRDIRPANILLSTPGAGEPRILLSDFGLARPADELAYAAPEEVTEGQVDGRADQYALAATAIHLFTGAPPALNPRDPFSPPPQLGELRPDLARLDAVLARALARDRAKRFDSCREFVTALAECSGVLDTSRTEAEGPAEAVGPPIGADYPAYLWPQTFDNRPQRFREPSSATAQGPTTTMPQSTRRSEVPPVGADRARRFGSRRLLIIVAAVALLGGLVAAGLTVARQTTDTRTANPATSAPAAPGVTTSTSPSSGPAAAPEPLEGTYLIDVQRSKQTFNQTPSPQPPDVKTWWAIRSSCTPARCLAAATLLDDTTHAQEKSPDIHPLVFEYGDGQWRSQPETLKFPCVHPDGSKNTQTTTQVVSLRPQPQGDLVGEMVVTVRTDECRQKGGVIRIPTVAGRRGEVPPAVNVPDPVSVPPLPPPPSEGPTNGPTGPGEPGEPAEPGPPTTGPSGPSGPGR